MKPLTTQVMMMAPTTPPQTEPPPSIIITIGRMAVVKANDPGVMARVMNANSPPARPQMTALVTKARSFQFAVRTPRVDEAISLVAIPRRARPMRYLRARSTKRITSTAITQMR